MHTVRVGNLTIRPLRNGDVATIEALLLRLGDGSRARRFGGAKPRVSPAELEQLARVDADRHALVAYVDGDRVPAGIAHLVRAGDTAEIAFAVADCYHRRGIGSALADRLTADARAAGVTHLRATVRGDNNAALALLARCTRIVEEAWAYGEREVVVAL